MKCQKCFKKTEYIGIVEIDENVYYIYRLNNKLLAGVCLNIGFKVLDSFEMDLDFSLDENLANFIEQLEKN